MSDNVNDRGLQTLTSIFREIFDNDTIVLSPSLSARDVQAWDSMAHISLMHAVEEYFSIRFSVSEMTRMRNVGDLVTALSGKGVSISW